MPTIATDKTTGEAHIYHRAHWVDGNMYYKGKLVIQAADEE
jgi:large subunit ribosomal protein L32